MKSPHRLLALSALLVGCSSAASEPDTSQTGNTHADTSQDDDTASGAESPASGDSGDAEGAESIDEAAADADDALGAEEMATEAAPGGDQPGGNSESGDGTGADGEAASEPTPEMITQDSEDGAASAGAEPAAGSEPAAESEPAAGSEPTVVDATPATQPDEPAPEDGPLEQGDTPTSSVPELERYWLAGGAIGNCIDNQQYLRFLPMGRVEYIIDDKDACIPQEEWATTVVGGTYTLQGRTLEYALEDGATTRFNIGLGDSSGTPLLYHHVYLPLDDGTWRSEHYFERRNVDGELERLQHVLVDLSFSEDITAGATDECRVTISFSIERIDEAPELVEYAGTADDLPCTLGESALGREIQIESLDFSEHPSWVPANLATVLPGSRLLFDASEPEFLFAMWYSGEEGVPERLE